MEIKLSENEKNVLDFIKSVQPDWVGPNRIGLQVGGLSSGGIQRHSAWASPICKRLVDKGLLERDTLGHYRPVGSKW